MDLSLIFGCAIVADVVILKLIPYRPGDEILWRAESKERAQR